MKMGLDVMLTNAMHLISIPRATKHLDTGSPRKVRQDRRNDSSFVPLQVRCLTRLNRELSNIPRPRARHSRPE